jgi:hypothetical protein
MDYSAKKFSDPSKVGFVHVKSIKELKIKRNILNFVNDVELNLSIPKFEDIKWNISNWLAR